MAEARPRRRHPAIPRKANPIPAPTSKAPARRVRTILRCELQSFCIAIDQVRDITVRQLPIKLAKWAEERAQRGSGPGWNASAGLVFDSPGPLRSDVRSLGGAAAGEKLLNGLELNAWLTPSMSNWVKPLTQNDAVVNGKPTSLTCQKP